MHSWATPVSEVISPMKQKTRLVPPLRLIDRAMPDRDRQHAGDNCRREDAVFGKTERDRTARHDLGLENVARNALEQALVMAPPGTKHPIFLADPPEDLDHLLLVAAIQDGRERESWPD